MGEGPTASSRINSALSGSGSDRRPMFVTAAICGLMAVMLVLGVKHCQLRTRIASLVQRVREIPRIPAADNTPGAVARVGSSAFVHSQNQAAFEGGNIGPIVRRDALTYDLLLRSDNDDDLPKEFRQWFYLRLDQMPKGRRVTINLLNNGFPYYFLPYFSYDNQHWQRFSERDVSQPSRYGLRVKYAFSQPTVWLARYVPYTYSQLNAYLQSISDHPDVQLSDIGTTPGGRAIPLLTIGAPQPGSEATKPWVLIHARTHPGEVGSSFFLEGLIDSLLAPTAAAKAWRAKYAFSIVPMLNVDGVVAGNNRTTPQSENLEGLWLPASASAAADPLPLDREHTPPEIQHLHQHFLSLIANGATIAMALNLHTSAGEPRDQMFCFPHFGPGVRGYTAPESRLWNKQIGFAHLLGAVAGPGWMSRLPLEGKREFLTKYMPEAWWWRNFQDRVLAMTLETVYGYAGNSRRWITPSDLHRLGAALAVAIVQTPQTREAQLANLSIPAYP